MKFFKIKDLDTNRNWSINPTSIEAIIEEEKSTRIYLSNSSLRVKETEAEIRKLMLQAE